MGLKFMGNIMKNGKFFGKVLGLSMLIVGRVCIE